MITRWPLFFFFMVPESSCNLFISPIIKLQAVWSQLYPKCSQYVNVTSVGLILSSLQEQTFFCSRCGKRVFRAHTAAVLFIACYSRAVCPRTAALQRTKWIIYLWTCIQPYIALSGAVYSPKSLYRCEWCVWQAQIKKWGNEIVWLIDWF